jgi:hypothetical protein
MASETFYTTVDGAARQQVLTEHGQLTQKKNQLEEDWLWVMAEIESLEQAQESEPT